MASQKFLPIPFLLLFPVALCAQVSNTQQQEIREKRIKTVITYSCRTSMGAVETCTPKERVTYDREGRMTEVTHAPGQAHAQQNFFRYDTAGNCIEEMRVYMNDTTITKNSFDSKGNMTGSETYKNGQLESTHTYTYKDGKRTSHITWSADRIPVYRLTFIYDDSGRLTGSQTINKSDTSLVRRYYDTKGRHSCDTFLSAPGVVSSVNTFTYENDTLASRCSVHAAGRIVKTNYTYDENKRLIRETRIDSGKTVNSRTINYFYDAQGRVIQEQYYGKQCTLVSREYDASGNLATKTSSACEATPGMQVLFERYKYELY